MEWQQVIVVDEYRFLISVGSYVSLGLLAIMLVLLLVPQSVSIKFTLIPINTVLSAILRHVGVVCVLYLSSSTVLCVAVASLVMYACIVQCVWTTLHIHDVHTSALAQVEHGKRPYYSITAW
uniref:Uncharacterized protein n=2 Tax=Ciona intestinalis TaxID=7719 RepID=F6QDY4_CIOIN